MPCAICNDAISFSDGSRVDVRPASDIELSANDCGYCKIILNVLHEYGVKGDRRLHVARDEDTSQTRATHGTKIMVIEAGQQYGSQFNFVVRNLGGGYQDKRLKQHDQTECLDVHSPTGLA